MADNYIPGPDGDFLAWEQNLLSYASANLVALGLVAGDLTAATGLQGAWETAYGDLQTQQAALASAAQLKNSLRQDYETALRALVRKLQAAPQVDDAERAALGITIRDATPTPTGAPATRPVLQADTGKPGQITVAFADEGTPTKKAKPAGVTACLLQSKKGAPAPAADADWQFLGLDSATPYLAAFDSADAGAPVWIRACWINSRQEQGPWSATLSTRVPG